MSDPESKRTTPTDEREGVAERQPDRLQPDVENLPDMSARPSAHLDDAQSEAEDDQQRQHILDTKNQAGASG